MIVSLIGLLISLFAYLLAFPNPQQRRFDIYLWLLALHLVATIGYWLLSFEAAMDAFTYYRDPYDFKSRDPLESGTYFIVHVDQTIRQVLGGSFLDHFLFFQCFGMVGIALLIRSFNEIAESLGMEVPVHAYMLLFLPGLHFWSSAIGKDAPMFLAVSLACWASLRIQKRAVWMVPALVLMALIRPHVGAIVLAAVVGGLMFSKQMAFRNKILLAPLVFAGFVFALLKTAEKFRLDLNPESFSDFVDKTQDLGERFGSGADLQSLPLPAKIFSLLFRPMFFDGTGMMHLAASVENLILVGIFLYIGYHWKLLFKLCRNVFYMSYLTMYSATLILLLSLINYNIGLGQRQKMMAIPAVLMICASILIYKRYLAAASRPVPDLPQDQTPRVAMTGA
jgi:hypothetical protein